MYADDLDHFSDACQCFWSPGGLGNSAGEGDAEMVVFQAVDAGAAWAADVVDAIGAEWLAAVVASVAGDAGTLLAEVLCVKGWSMWVPGLRQVVKVALEGLGCPFCEVSVKGAAVSGDGGGGVVVGRVVELDCEEAGCRHAVQDDPLCVRVIFAKFVYESGGDVWR